MRLELTEVGSRMRTLKWYHVLWSDYTARPVVELAVTDVIAQNEELAIAALRRKYGRSIGVEGVFRQGGAADYYRRTRQVPEPWMLEEN